MKKKDWLRKWHWYLIAFVCTLILAVVILTPGLSVAQQTNQEQKWWPSRYGANDVVGAINEVTPQKVNQAAQLIKQGKVYDLQLTLEAGRPAFPPRFYQFQMMYNIHKSRWLGANHFSWGEEIVAANLGTFTQIDCLGHAGIEERFYNGRAWEDIATPTGLKTIGCEQALPVMTRGVMVDIAAYKKVSVLPDNYVITPDDIEGALKQQGNTKLEPGDIVIFNTGWIQTYWLKDGKRYMSSEPGIGIEAAKWLIQRRVVAVGADNWGVEAFPLQNGNLFPSHQEFITKNGIYLMENVVTEQLARNKVYEFAFVMTFLKAKGAGQTWGTFAAVR